VAQVVDAINGAAQQKGLGEQTEQSTG